MEMLLSIVQYFVDLGAAVMLPIVIFFVALSIGTPVAKALKCGISIGIGFIGIGLVISLMLTNLAPAAQAMSANFGINMGIIDLGWPGTAPMTWASRIALVAIPVAIAVNLLMLALRRRSSPRAPVSLRVPPRVSARSIRAARHSPTS